MPTGTISEPTWQDPECFLPAETWLPQTWCQDPEIDIAAFESSPLGGATPAAGEWAETYYNTSQSSSSDDSSTVEPLKYRWKTLDNGKERCSYCWTSSCIRFSQNWKSNGVLYISRRSCISKAARKSKITELLAGTCEWFLASEEFTRWRTESSGHIWLSGASGAGKSVLASVALQSLETNRKPGEFVAFHFTDGDFKGVNHTASILWAMQEEILSREPLGNHREDLLSLLTDLAQLGGHLSSSRMKYFLSKIRRSLRNHETLYLLLDGLDEASQSPQEAALMYEFIDHATRYDPRHRIKCFISTTPAFFHRRPLRSSTQIDLDASSLTLEDMSLYMQRAFENRKLSYHSPNIKDWSLQLPKSVKGSFLLLRLIIDGMEDNSALETVAKSFDPLGTMDLASMYGNMLGHIDDCNREAAFSMLRWAIYVARPLESWELLDALHRQTGIELKVDDISNISAGLLTTAGSKIRLAHFTVRHYLQSRMKGSWEELSYEANEMIAHACLKLLSTNDLLLSLGLRSSRDPKTEPTHGHHSLLPYAQRYWMYHYLYAEQESSYLAGLLHEMLEESLRGNSKELQTSSSSANTLEESRSIPGHFSSLELVNTAARVGSQFGFATLVKFELDMGATVDSTSGPEKRTLLCWAAVNGHLHIVKLLLRYGADPQRSCGFGRTPLMYAMSGGHYQIVEVLLAHEWQNLRGSSAQRVPLPPDTIVQRATQDYWLEAVVSSSCNGRDIQVNHQLSLIPAAPNQNITLPPICVRSDYISKADGVQCNTDAPVGENNFRMIVKWFPGVQMYYILCHAAACGIDDVKRLLVIAGNNIHDLESVPLSNLISDLRMA